MISFAHRYLYLTLQLDFASLTSSPSLPQSRPPSLPKTIAGRFSAVFPTFRPTIMMWPDVLLL
jgi:hypothetical protein